MQHRPTMRFSTRLERHTKRARYATFATRHEDHEAKIKLIHIPHISKLHRNSVHQEGDPEGNHEGLMTSQTYSISGLTTELGNEPKGL